MDNSTTTKYFNYAKKRGSGSIIHPPGVGTGFIVIPFKGKPTVACGLLFATADDMPQRDPMEVTLQGSNETNDKQLRKGTRWSLIYSGSTGIDTTIPLNRSLYGIQQKFANKQHFTTYRLLITKVRGSHNDGVQYSEARILGYLLP
ncbi:hypothetical protein I4U23_020164 [Adineta vaga]|nr:hypothetical protein I4U23_020164 [Adineta vaga]